MNAMCTGSFGDSLCTWLPNNRIDGFPKLKVRKILDTTFIKYSKRSSDTAKNVAWDLLYWVMLEIDYHQGRYENTIVCTSDHALAELLSSRINRGPRGRLTSPGQANTVVSYGDMYPAKFKRLENTKIEKEILQKLSQLLVALELVENDYIKFGFNEL